MGYRRSGIERSHYQGDALTLRGDALGASNWEKELWRAAKGSGGQRKRANGAQEVSDGLQPCSRRPAGGPAGAHALHSRRWIEAVEVEGGEQLELVQPDGRRV